MHNKKMTSEEEFNEWWENHKNECHANFQGSSGTMDSEGCVRMFKRSVEKQWFKVCGVSRRWRQQSTQQT